MALFLVKTWLYFKLNNFVSLLLRVPLYLGWVSRVQCSAAGVSSSHLWIEEWHQQNLNVADLQKVVGIQTRRTDAPTSLLNLRKFYYFLPYCTSPFPQYKYIISHEINPRNSIRDLRVLKMKLKLLKVKVQVQLRFNSKCTIWGYNSCGYK